MPEVDETVHLPGGNEKQEYTGKRIAALQERRVQDSDRESSTRTPDGLFTLLFHRGKYTIFRTR